MTVLSINEIRTELAAIRADHAALHLKADLTIRAIIHLLTRHPDMAIHDELLTALGANDAALVAVGAKVDSLIAEKSATDTAFTDVLPRVTAQGSAIAALDAKIASALPAADSAPVASPVSTDASTGPSAAAPTVAPEAAAPPAPAPSIVIPTSA